MAKVLLVEDDNNLREIYQARLMAEGYDIVTAQNGEEALVVAKQNKPDLIISDVMMPRISGFEMLDILRNTAELKSTKVIMLTALGQEDDQKRADSLGADKYLVKSQVTLEDIVNAAKELLSEDGSTPTAKPQPGIMPDPLAVAPAAPGIPAIAHVPDPGTPPTPVPAAAPQPVPTPTLTPVAPAVTPTPVATEPAASASTPAPVTPAPLPSTPATTTPTTPLGATPSPDPVAAATVPAMPPTAPETTTPAPVEEPMAVQPEPMPTPSGPTEPATPPASATVDAAAQGLEAEEAALQAQIASYSQTSATPTPVAPDTAAAPAAEAANDASNTKAIDDAVEKLEIPSIPEPAQPPSVANAPAITPAPESSAPQTSATTLSPAPKPSTPATSAADSVTVAGKKVIQPINDPTAKPDLNALLAKEEAKEPTPAAPVVNGSAGQPPAPAGGGAPGQGFDPNTSL